MNMNSVYSTNCPPLQCRIPRLYEERVRSAPGFQEAPTLQQMWDRDAARLQKIRGMGKKERVVDQLFATKIESCENPELKKAYQKAYNFERVTAEEGLLMLEQGDLNTLGYLATRIKERFHPEPRASFLIDRNINYTNVCRIGCDFCAFYRREKEDDAYVLSKETIYDKIEETIACGGTGVLMQGGVNPRLKIEYYEDLFKGIRERFNIHLHALSVIEIEGIARVSQLSVEDTLKRLHAAGLDSIPGAGAEILVDEVRLDQSPVKRHSKRWIDVMQQAHKLGLPTTATMMFGALEQNKHVIEHIELIRKAQDQTGGFYAFIMWTFQGENTELIKKHPDIQPVSGVEYLKVVAVSRIMMDNIPNIQGSWVTMGPKMGQASLHYGANDVGSIMIEENVVSAAGTAFELTRQSMIDLVSRSGFIPVQRDTYYNILGEYPETFE